MTILRETEDEDECPPFVFSIRDEELYARLEFLFDRVRRLEERESVAQDARDRARGITWNQVCVFSEPFKFILKDESGREKGSFFTIFNSAKYRYLGNGELRENRLFTADEGKLVYEFKAMLEIFFLRSPYGKNYSYVAEDGLRISNRRLSDETLAETREAREEQRRKDLEACENTASDEEIEETGEDE